MNVSLSGECECGGELVCMGRLMMGVVGVIVVFCLIMDVWIELCVCEVD